HAVILEQFASVVAEPAVEGVELSRSGIVDAHFVAARISSSGGASGESSKNGYQGKRQNGFHRCRGENVDDRLQGATENCSRGGSIGGAAALSGLQVEAIGRLQGFHHSFERQERRGWGGSTPPPGTQISDSLHERWVGGQHREQT